MEGEASHTGVPWITFTNQEDNVTQQLNVRSFMQIKLLFFFFLLIYLLNCQTKHLMFIYIYIYNGVCWCSFRIVVDGTLYDVLSQQKIKIKDLLTGM
jgi:hypothetical protein